MDINIIILVGYLTADPELRITDRGTEIGTMRLAVNRLPKDGERQSAIFIDVATFGRLATAVTKNLTKGRQVVVTGRLEFRQWEKDGVNYSRHSVIAHQVQFLGWPRTNGNSEPEPAYAAGEESF